MNEPTGVFVCTKLRPWPMGADHPNLAAHPDAVPLDQYFVIEGCRIIIEECHKGLLICPHCGLVIEPKLGEEAPEPVQVVPVTPTKEMLIAASNDLDGLPFWPLEMMWAAMLKACRK